MTIAKKMGEVVEGTECVLKAHPAAAVLPEGGQAIENMPYQGTHIGFTADTLTAERGGRTS